MSSSEGNLFGMDDASYNHLLEELRDALLSITPEQQDYIEELIRWRERSERKTTILGGPSPSARRSRG